MAYFQLDRSLLCPQGLLEDCTSLASMTCSLVLTHHSLQRLPRLGHRHSGRLCGRNGDMHRNLSFLKYQQLSCPGALLCDPLPRLRMPQAFPLRPCQFQAQRTDPVYLPDTVSGSAVGMECVFHFPHRTRRFRVNLASPHPLCRP